MKFFRTFAYLILAAIAVNIAGSALIEYTAMKEKETALRHYVRLAYDETILGLQDTTTIGGTSSFKFDRDDLNFYLDKLSQGNLNGPRSAQLSDIIRFMRPSSNTAGVYSQFYPIQFGLTYIPKKQFEDNFKKNLERYVSNNFGDNTKAGLRGQGSLIIDTPIITLDGPILLSLDPSNPIVISSMFGTLDPAKVNMKFGAEDRFKFVIVYNIKIDIKWRHVTTTPFFKNSLYTNRYRGPLGHLTNQAIMQGSNLQYSRQYKLLN